VTYLIDSSAWLRASGSELAGGTRPTASGSNPCLATANQFLGLERELERELELELELEPELEPEREQGPGWGWSRS